MTANNTDNKDNKILKISIISGVFGLIVSAIVYVVSLVDNNNELAILKTLTGILSLSSGVLAAIVGIVFTEFFNSNTDRQKHTNDIINKIELLDYSIANSNGGIVYLGDISNACNKLIPIVKKSKKIRDIAYRIDNLNPRLHDEWMSSWYSIISERICSDDFKSYEITICDKSEDYYKSLFNNINKSKHRLKFHCRIVNKEVSVPYPNFLIFYNEDNSKDLVIGWPFVGGEGDATNDIFLINNNKIVDYFEKIFVTGMSPLITNKYQTDNGEVNPVSIDNR